jgi:4-amino-4-deoxy-L-arabinose transferase-like glycosyltransferase
MNLWLVAILLLSSSLRVGALAIRGLPVDESRHYEIALNVAEGRGFTFCNSYFPFCGPDNNQTATVGPVPILVFAALMVAFGDLAIYLIVALQMLLGLVTTVFIYKIAMRLFGSQRNALLGALFWGTFLPMISLELRVEAEAIFTCLLSAGILALLYGWSNNRVFTWMLAGICFGLASLSRAPLLYFLPISIIFIMLTPSVRVRRRLMNSGIFLVAFILILTPWIVRNALVFNAFIPGGTLNGYNLYRHNYIIADDNYLRYVQGEEAHSVRDRLIEEGKWTHIRGDENEFEMDRIYQREAMQIIKAYPHRYLLLSLYRLLPLWTDIGVIEPLPALWQLLALENIVLIVLAVATVVRRRRMTPNFLLILTLIGYYTLGHMMVNAQMRYSTPIMPYVIILASDQCVYLAFTIRDFFKRQVRVNLAHITGPR